MSTPTPMRLLIRADGTERNLDGPMTIADIGLLIDADICDSILLDDGYHVMVIDDLGHPKNRPVNRLATVLYHRKCVPGTVWPIRGDVVIVPDRDFAPVGGPFERHSPPL